MSTHIVKIRDIFKQTLPKTLNAVKTRRRRQTVELRNRIIVWDEEASFNTKS